MATEFTSKVMKIIHQIPCGKVATYGQIAELAGKPGAARGVSWILHSSAKAHGLPWQRVLGAKGRISFPLGTRHFNEQRRLLEKENVIFSENGHVEMGRFQWKRKAAKEKRGLR
jgi:methylated-DNA-protein-cysteine methyltransferase related protein